MFAYLELWVIVFSDMDVEGMDVQIADQSGKPLQLPPAEKKVCSCSTLCMVGNFYAFFILSH